MAGTRANLSQSVLLVVDVQPTFLNGIFEADRVLRRTEFALRVAKMLAVPILATEQYPERMGGTDESLKELIPGEFITPKMAFSCCGGEGFGGRLNQLDRRQAILVGIESHICVSQTAHDLIDQGYEVIVCEDAVSARDAERHRIGINRMRDAGAIIAHTESVAYEWMGSASHPQFREALKLVKEFSNEPSKV